MSWIPVCRGLSSEMPHGLDHIRLKRWADTRTGGLADRPTARRGRTGETKQTEGGSLPRHRVRPAGLQAKGQKAKGKRQDRGRGQAGQATHASTLGGPYNTNKGSEKVWQLPRVGFSNPSILHSPPVGSPPVAPKPSQAGSPNPQALQGTPQALEPPGTPSASRVPAPLAPTENLVF